MVLFTEIGKRQYELYPFLFMKGFSEVDDVMHNTVGCLIGYGIMTILRIIFNTRYNNV